MIPEPIVVECGNQISYYRLNVGTMKKIREKTGLDFFAREPEKTPSGNIENITRSIEAIADPPIVLDSAHGEELVQICKDFNKEIERFFPAGGETESPTESPTTPSEP